MAKLFIVCPSCSSKYPVADQKLAGRKVTCKKCTHKFVAEIKGAAPPPEEELAPIPADDPFASSASTSDPLGDDLFGDFPTSESAAPASPLGSLPPKQKKAPSGGGFAVVPVLLSVARVTGVAIVVIITYSSLFPTPGSGQSAPGGNPPHRGPEPRGFGRSNPPSAMPGQPPGGRPANPSGWGSSPPGSRGMSDGAQEFRKDPVGQMTADYGEDKITRIEADLANLEQFKRLVEVLKPWMIANTHTGSFGSGNDFIVFPYDGDVRELVSKINIGEVQEIDVNKRTIRYKSLDLP